MDKLVSVGQIGGDKVESRSADAKGGGKPSE